jgi:hypothetical protein
MNRYCYLCVVILTVICVCLLQNEAEQCQFIEWIDEAWPKPLQDSLKKLWRELRLTRRSSETSNEVLIDALRCNDVANADRVKLLDDLNRTKALADRVIASYHKKAAVVAVDKSKLMYLVYCLLGLIAFLVSLLMTLILKK